MLGSNDGAAWNVLHNISDAGSWTNDTRHFKLPAIPPPFSFFRMAVNRVGQFDDAGLQNSVTIEVWDLFHKIISEDSFFVEAAEHPPNSVRLHSASFVDHYLQARNNPVDLRQEVTGDLSSRNATIFQFAT